MLCTWECLRKRRKNSKVLVMIIFGIVGDVFLFEFTVLVKAVGLGILRDTNTDLSSRVWTIFSKASSKCRIGLATPQCRERPYSLRPK